MISLCGAEGWAAFRTIGMRCFALASRQPSEKSLPCISVLGQEHPPSSPRLLFAAGHIFWIILLVAVGKTLRSEDLLCRTGVDGTSSGNAEGQEACASAAGSWHFFRKCCRCDGNGNLNASSLQTWCFVYNPGRHSYCTCCLDHLCTGMDCEIKEIKNTCSF